MQCYWLFAALAVQVLAVGVMKPVWGCCSPRAPKGWRDQLWCSNVGQWESFDPLDKLELLDSQPAAFNERLTAVSLHFERSADVHQVQTFCNQGKGAFSMPGVAALSCLAIAGDCWDVQLSSLYRCIQPPLCRSRMLANIQSRHSLGTRHVVHAPRTALKVGRHCLIERWQACIYGAALHPSLDNLLVGSEW